MDAVKRELREIPLDSIELPGRPLRTLTSDEEFSELRASMAARGLLVPVLVTETKEGYKLVAGQRRFLSAVSLGWATISALVVEAPEEYVSWATLAENRVREAVNAWDEAAWVALTMNRRGLDQRAVAAELGVSEAWVSKRLSVLEWPVDVQDALRQGLLAFGVGLEIAKITDDHVRAYCVDLSRRCGCSVRQAQAWVRSWRRDSGLRMSTTGDVALESPGPDEGPLGPCGLCGQEVPRDQLQALDICARCVHQVEHFERK